MLSAAATDSEIRSLNSLQAGPETKEYNLLRADEEYREGNRENSIYYQVRGLFQGADLRLSTEAHKNQQPNISEIRVKATKRELNDFRGNSYVSNILKHQKTKSRPAAAPQLLDPLDFLDSIEDPLAGYQRIAEICGQLPQEWCVLQLCKSFNPATTYSTYYDIAGSNGDIYVSLLRHCRSPNLGPTCLRFSHENLAGVFKEYGTLVERYRSVVTVDPLAVKSNEAKAKYWSELNGFGNALKKLIEQLSGIFLPYGVMFLGRRYHCASLEDQEERVYCRVDMFCLAHNWSSHQRILLSQAALHANRLSDEERRQLCQELSRDQPHPETEELLAYELLEQCAEEWQLLEEQEPLLAKRFPNILIVDERLDHMHWEQLAPQQECTRIKSLHGLWRLYNYHKERIQHGYYTANITRGMTLINPDADLVNSGRRLRSFLEYWLGHWRHMFETLPTEQLMTEEAFQADCFVYAGHGSTLQYVSSRVIYRNRIRGVVFLFGCDSTRLMSSGLYSALYGAQDYYHGALCPTVVGTLMPALDGNMDNVSANLLSRWIAPAEPQVTPWTHIDRAAWISQGTVTAQEGVEETVADLPDYQVGSLCSLLASIQQGKVEPKIYNSCIYVCRGLPAWNLDVQPLPFYSD